ncbi:hypothetical protein HZA57_10015, partial [Candidatus Poribacteria bacterium]|nr:hypothetical protein [Candidatus Poribacteria bacterium]
MINPIVERRYADCTELVEGWRHFLNLFTRTLKSESKPTSEDEHAFMECKAKIAMLHD